MSVTAGGILFISLVLAAPIVLGLIIFLIYRGILHIKGEAKHTPAKETLGMSFVIAVVIVICIWLLIYI